LYPLEINAGAKDWLIPTRPSVQSMATPLPAATVARLPRYLRCLSDMAHTSSTCSSDELADEAGVTAAQVRKDLSYLGSHGTRGVGYDIPELRGLVRNVLGMATDHPVVIIGAGNLGSALTNYKGFESWGFDIVGLLDVDETKIGQPVDGLTVESISHLERIVDERGVEIGIIATPPSAAQPVADRLSRAGIRSILNLAPTVLKAAEGVSIRRVDLSTELGILAFHLKGE
jgi:redox-sensing transcriptional repressor